jgi:hypothetical protein
METLASKPAGQRGEEECGGSSTRCSSPAAPVAAVAAPLAPSSPAITPGPHAHASWDPTVASSSSAASSAAGSALLHAAARQLGAQLAALEAGVEAALRAHEAAERRLEEVEAARAREHGEWEALLGGREAEAGALRGRVRAAGAGRVGGPEGGDVALLRAYKAENQAAARRVKVGGGAVVVGAGFLLCLQSY